VPEDVLKLTTEANEESDPKKQAELWVEWQKRLVDQANHFILFQPIYQIATRSTLAKLPLTAAGWMLDMYAVKPA
jgi:peptide/nickel transport system substrate-binding protein